MSRERKESFFYKLLTSSLPVEQREYSRGRGVPAVGAMLRQDELAFIEAISNIEFSTFFLQELRKAVAAGKKKKALAASKANATSASALVRNSGVPSEALTSRDSPQFHVSKRKAEELSSSDCPSEPASPRPASEQLFGDGPRPRAPRAN